MNELTQDSSESVEALTATLRDIPDVGNSWWRYFTALMRAINRERSWMMAIALTMIAIVTAICSAIRI